jgi:hypothetical protein
VLAQVFERKGVALPEQLRQRARQRFGAAHDDLPAIGVTSVPVVLVATKWDVFSTRDAEEQRIVCAALRCLAHANAAHLVCLGGLQPGGGAGVEGEPATLTSLGGPEGNYAPPNAFAVGLGHLLCNSPFGAFIRALPARAGLRAGGVGTSAPNDTTARQQAAALDGFSRLIQHLAFVGLDSKL